MTIRVGFIGLGRMGLQMCYLAPANLGQPIPHRKGAQAMTIRVGFIGLGRMGLQMCYRLL